MNERIRELAHEAGLPTYNPEGVPTKLEKFAELIVKECADICNALQDIPATEPRHCAEDIKIHFGVEE